LNVAGRQRHGVVPTSERDALCHRVAGLLAAWRNADGQPVVRRVRIGPYAGAATRADCLPPDLAIDWDPAAARPNLHPAVSGDHTLDGALIVAGPGVPRGRIPDCRLIDVAPVALAALGVSPAGAGGWTMDGRLPAALAALRATPGTRAA
jgi:predicted AlkP superfamily phosphohydrolase/phosphomutase